MDGWMDGYCKAIARGLEIITCFVEWVFMMMALGTGVIVAHAY
jgi:hypothetical protein